MDGRKDSKRNRGRSRSEVGKWRMRLDVGGLVGGWIKGKGQGRGGGVMERAGRWMDTAVELEGKDKCGTKGMRE